MPDPKPSVLSRAQRAHFRLSWQERLARNARAPGAGQVSIKLFGIPKASQLSSACSQCNKSSRYLRSWPPLLGKDRFSSPKGPLWVLFLLSSSVSAFVVSFAFHSFLPLGFQHLPPVITGLAFIYSGSVFKFLISLRIPWELRPRLPIVLQGVLWALQGSSESAGECAPTESPKRFSWRSFCLP